MGFIRDICEFSLAITCGLLPIQTLSSLSEEQKAKKQKKEHDALIPPKLSSRRRQLSLSSSNRPVQTTTLLTRLPLEIREMIYEEVLGNSLLHIVSLPRRMGHITCQLQDRDHRLLCFPLNRDTDHRVSYRRVEGQHNLYLRGTQGQEHMAMWAPPDCGFHNDFDISQSKIPLLQSCRQIYSEGINLLYTKNTFDFAHPETFIWFTRTIRPEKLALITSLQLCMVSRTFSVGLTRLWIDMCVIISTQMPGLKHICIFLLAEHLHETWRQDRLLRPLVDLRELQSFDLQIRELAEGHWIPIGGTEVVASPFVTTLKEKVLQPREHNDV
jgi:hypothetical protein